MPGDFAPILAAGRAAIVASPSIVCVDVYQLGLKDSWLSTPDSTAPTGGDGWSSVVERPMEPILIIVPTPGFKHHAGFEQAVNAFRLETFTAKGPFQPFLPPILPGLARRNPTGRAALSLKQREQRLRHQLRPMLTPKVQRGRREPQAA